MLFRFTYGTSISCGPSPLFIFSGDIDAKEVAEGLFVDATELNRDNGISCALPLEMVQQR